MGNILPWLQERIKHWIKPAIPDLILGVFSDITRSRADLMVENALLRQQLIVLKRPLKQPSSPTGYFENKLSLPWIVKRNLQIEIFCVKSQKSNG